MRRSFIAVVVLAFAAGIATWFVGYPLIPCSPGVGNLTADASACEQAWRATASPTEQLWHDYGQLVPWLVAGLVLVIGSAIVGIRSRARNRGRAWG